MIWENGYSTDYILMTVDPESWADRSTLRLTGGTIDRQIDGLLESAELVMTESPGEQWVRVYLHADQSGDSARIPLFTGLTSAPDREMDGTRDNYRVDCYSTLKPAADIMLPRGWYASAGVNGAQVARDLLACGPAPVSTDDHSPYLRAGIVAEDDETRLSMARKIVDAIGWQIRISGNGAIRIQPTPADPAATFGALSGDIVEPKVTDSRDWYSCPNVFRAISDDLTAVAKDEDPDSPLSTVSRSREIWAQETDVKLSAGETLSEYAVRRLKELQSPARKLSYTRRFLPNVYVGDTVIIQYPSVGIDGQFQITEQSIDLGYACRTSEEANEQ